MKPMRMLVFSSTFGAGHVQAAEALIESIQEIEPTMEVIHLDFMTLVSKVLNNIVRMSYIWTIKHVPKLWGKFYEKTANISNDSLLQHFFNNLGRTKFIRYIELNQPDLIVCTYPTIAGIIAQLKRNRKISIPLVIIITDYTIHSQWIHPGVDLYLVGSQEVYDSLISRGVDPIQICITGIPVKAKFECDIERDKVLGKLNLLSDRPTFLIMGGAYGIFGNTRLLRKIINNTKYPLQAIVVCGENKKLYHSLENVVLKGKNPVIRLGFVDNIHELMTVADIILTKAGGLTVSEALTKSLPIVIYKPISGQEERNAMYIKRTNTGKVVHTKKELIQTIHELLQNPEGIQMMRYSSAGVVPRNSARRAAHEILKRYYRSNMFEETQRESIFYA